jgi:hypothetical protein
MNNIAEMLRTPTGCTPPSKWELEGAREIERLRAALFQIQCEQLAVATNKEMTARSHRTRAMRTRNRIIKILKSGHQ